MKKFLIIFFLAPLLVFAQDVKEPEKGTNGYQYGGGDLRHFFSEEYDSTTLDIPKNKTALVIGNTDYDDDSWDLKNPTNDVNLFSKSLNKIGFDVELKEDLDREEFIKHFVNFKGNQDSSDFIIIYYAGHAIEENGIPYILPTNFSHDENTNIEDRGINIYDLLDSYKKTGKKCLFILDACRKVGGNGLPVPLDVEGGVNVKLAYSTSWGKGASDNTILDNTHYTSVLSGYFRYRPDASIYEILHNTAKRVIHETIGKQKPASYFGIYVDDVRLK